jgi:hypothetical protein
VHESAFYLGELYYYGWGVKRNYKSAFDYLLEAARYGEPQAQWRLATLYLNGLGVVQSEAEAYMWAAIAAANGNEQAIETRTSAQARLSSAVLELARMRAANWGKGSNAVAYSCKITSENWDDFGDDTLSVDLDSWEAQIPNDKYRRHDAVLDGDEIQIRKDFWDEQHTINRKTGQYTVKFKWHDGQQKTQRGTCKFKADAAAN